MKGSSSTQISMKINLLALAISMWTLVYTIADLFNANASFRIIVSTIVSVISFGVGYYFAEDNSDCTKSWDDEED